MVKSENIEYAIQQTLIAHPEFRPYLTQMLLRNIQKEIYLRSFTSQNGAREKMEGLRDIDLVNYVVEQLVKIVNAATYYAFDDPDIEIEPDEVKYNRLLQTFPYYAESIELLEKCADSNKILYFLTNPIDMIRAVDCVTKTMFSTDQVTEYINAHREADIPLKNTTTSKLLKELEQEYTCLEALKNLQVNRDSYNLCLVDIMIDKQLVNMNNEYSLYGQLYASQNVGRKRENQEDSVLIMEHPADSSLKLLAVSDGVGSAQYGEKASSYMVAELSKWFSVLPVELFSKPGELQELFNRKIDQISNEIYKEYNKDGKFLAGATFTGAIVAREKTLVSSVGDSRAYTLTNDGRIDIVTRDESAVWPRKASASQLGFDYIDDIRFSKNSNKIINAIGYKMIEEMQCYQLDNNSYDKLLLLTDGVSDLLKTERIKFIAQTTPKDLITKMLVDEAISKDAVREKDNNVSEFYDYIQAGKDNASAAMYVRR